MNLKDELNFNLARLNELLGKKEKQEEQDKHTALVVFAILGGIALIAAVAYGVYRFFTPDYLEDFEDDFEDDFDDDFFDEDVDEITE